MNVKILLLTIALFCTLLIFNSVQATTYLFDMDDEVTLNTTSGWTSVDDLEIWNETSSSSGYGWDTASTNLNSLERTNDPSSTALTADFVYGGNSNGTFVGFLANVSGSDCWNISVLMGEETYPQFRLYVNMQENETHKTEFPECEDNAGDSSTNNEPCWRFANKTYIPDGVLNITFMREQTWIRIAGITVESTVCDAAPVADTTPPNVDFVSPTETNDTVANNGTYIVWNLSVSEDIGACKIEINGTNQTGTILNATTNSYCYYNETGLTSNVTRCAYGWASDASDNFNKTNEYICMNITVHDDVDSPVQSLVNISGDTSSPYNLTSMLLYIWFTTDENADCRGSFDYAGETFSSYTLNCTGNGTTEHMCYDNSHNGLDIDYYINCQDPTSLSATYNYSYSASFATLTNASNVAYYCYLNDAASDEFERRSDTGVDNGRININLHGRGENGDDRDTGKFADAFAGLDYTVFAPDFQPYDNVTNWYDQDAIQCERALRQYMNREYNDSWVVITGMSMGASASQDIAGQYPEWYNGTGGICGVSNYSVFWEDGADPYPQELEYHYGGSPLTALSTYNTKSPIVNAATKYANMYVGICAATSDAIINVTHARNLNTTLNGTTEIQFIEVAGGHCDCSAANTVTLAQFLTNITDDVNPPAIDFVSPTTTNGTEADNKTYIIWNISVSERIGNCQIEINGTNQTGTILNGTTTNSYCYYNDTALSGNVTHCATGWASDSSDNFNQTDNTICRTTSEQNDTTSPNIDFTSPTSSNTTNTYKQKYITWNLTSSENIASCKIEINGTNQTGTILNATTSYCYYNETGFSTNVTRCTRGWASDASDNFNETLTTICITTAIETTTSEDPPSGGGGGNSNYCGNGICISPETYETCPQDCSLPIQNITDIINITIPEQLQQIINETQQQINDLQNITINFNQDSDINLFDFLYHPVTKIIILISVIAFIGYLSLKHKNIRLSNKLKLKQLKSKRY